MNIIAVDDEMLVLQQTFQVLKKVFSGEDTIEIFQEPKEAVAFSKSNQIDIAFLDIEMGEITGISLAKQLKEYSPFVNIIFVTAYREYALDAMEIRASGYLMKPISEKAILLELENLRNPVVEFKSGKPEIHTFGFFELFVDGKPVHFRRRKSKELLAFLVDRRGASVTRQQIAATLWEDRPMNISLSKIMSICKADMIKDLKIGGADNIIVQNKNEIAVDVNAVDCDYYNFLKGNVKAINSFLDEYMTDYAWAEFTLGALSQKNKKIY